MPIFTKSLQLSRQLGANEHGKALVWLWDADTNTGRIDAVGSIIYVDAPSDLVGEAVSYQEIRLSWVNNSPVDVTFQIFRSDSPSVISQLADASEVTYSDMAIGYPTSYYRVAAIYEDQITNNVVGSNLSNLITVVMPDPVGATNLNAVKVGGDVHLTWVATLDPFSSGLQVRRTNSGDEQILDILATDATDYIDVGAPSGLNDYKILSNGAINYTDSNHVQVTI